MIHQAYYARAVGRWRGFFTLSLKSPASLWTGPTPWVDKGRIFLMASLQSLLGRWTIETEVTALTSHEIAHRFWLKIWGLTLYASEERFSLLPHAHTFNP